MKLKLAYILISSTFLLKVLCSNVHSRIAELLFENISKFCVDSFICADNCDVNDASLCTFKVVHKAEIRDLNVKEETIESISITGSSKKILSRDYLSSLPDPLIILISSYLDFKLSQSSLIETSKHLNDVIYKSIDTQIRAFCPYLVFKERWMNRIMNWVLDINFKGISNVQDERIYDALELLNIKHINQYYQNFLNNGTIDLVLNFLFTIVYGPNEVVSFSSDHWRQNFIQRLLKHEMPRCTEYYFEEFLSHNKRDIYLFYVQNISMVKDQIINIFDFFHLFRSKHRDEDDLLSFFNSYMASNEIITDLVRFAPEFEVFALLNYHDNTMLPDEIIESFWTLWSKSAFSQSLLDLFPSNSDFLLYFLQDKSYKKESRLISALYKKLINIDDAPLKYLWTRDLLNPFDMQVFINLSGENLQKDITRAISQLATCRTLDLIHLQIFRKIIQSGIFDFSVIESQTDSLQNIIRENSPLLFAIFRDEVQIPVN